MATEGAGDILPYSSTHLEVGERDAALTAMCYGVRLHIQVTSEDLCGTQDDGTTQPASKFSNFVKTLDTEAETMRDFEDWVFRPCVPHIRHLAFLEDRTAQVTLHDYYRPTTLIFALKNMGGQLEARRLPDDPSTISHLTPKVPISDPAVSSAIQQGIPCIAASRLLVIRDPDLSDWDYYEVPKLVQKIGVENQQLDFKAAVEKGSFMRELDVLVRLKSINEDIRVPRLVGLVQWEDDGSIAGLLMKNIPQATTLDWALEGSSHDGRTRWMSELRHTVKILHDAQLVWGDVKPQNVLIDAERRAWVIDFGGGYSPSFVDENLQDTKEGDLQGLDAIAKYLSL